MDKCATKIDSNSMCFFLNVPVFLKLDNITYITIENHR